MTIGLAPCEIASVAITAMAVGEAPLAAGMLIGSTVRQARRWPSAWASSAITSVTARLGKITPIHESASITAAICANTNRALVTECHPVLGPTSRIADPVRLELALSVSVAACGYPGQVASLAACGEGLSRCSRGLG
jgi:hypothetical protein